MDYLVLLLVAAACPIAMGVMTWLLMRMSRTQGRPAAMAARPAGPPQPEDRPAQLRAELGEIRAQQAALQTAIDRLATGDPQVVPDAVVLSEASRPAAAPPGSAHEKATGFPRARASR